MPEHDTVAYVKDSLQVVFLVLAAVWLVHSFAKGNAGEIKRAVSAG